MLIDDNTRQQQTREIELELVRVRSAAEAARLEARAAELELMLRRLARGGDIDLSSFGSLEVPPGEPQPTGVSASPTRAAGQTPESWSERLIRLQARDAAAPASFIPSSSLTVASPSTPAIAPWVPKLPPTITGDEGHDQARRARVDRVPHAVPTPHFDEPANAASDQDIVSAPADVLPEPTPSTESKSVTMPTPSIDPFPKPAAAKKRKSLTDSTHPTELPATNPKGALPIGMSQVEPAITKVPLPAVNNGGEKADQQVPWRFRPASWMVSTLAHVVILVMLGVMTLANSPPRDQLAFMASSSESSEVSVETFSIQSSEPQQIDAAPSEPTYDVSAVGTMATTEVSMDISSAPALPSTSDLLGSSNSSTSSSLMKSLNGDSKAKIQFCGVEGGGSHFIYLVDSSNSMHEGFQSARAELLASIEALTPDQRFYVIFFDKEPDFMRISDPNVDEPASVMATADNKQRLRRWATTIEQNIGLHPTKLLSFALKLRPDVIFLLSDGEFPASVGELLRKENLDENLFGESEPISIVHTIRYHGIEGDAGRQAEATMTKIAKENGGQYRHVPKPK